MRFITTDEPATKQGDSIGELARGKLISFGEYFRSSVHHGIHNIFRPKNLMIAAIGGAAAATMLTHPEDTTESVDNVAYEIGHAAGYLKCNYDAGLKDAPKCGEAFAESAEGTKRGNLFADAAYNAGKLSAQIGKGFDDAYYTKPQEP